MTKLFLISYDLHHGDRNYSDFYNEIKQLGYSWAHPLESTWVIKLDAVNSLTTQKASSQLRKFIDTKDSLFVVDITGKERDGWLQKSFWEWINQD